ncbi:hypothetical protein CHS0354_032726 [Potamilus streckersoni]|uniref:Uncharacterized protein n=1 Tax=Potamilus streckersoni TaxID=2493646 RepID=A0AAE0RRB4_9BIVA|nr:hypothetical protein CHS0354_032726 [Potamilus streckersoni]
MSYGTITSTDLKQNDNSKLESDDRLAEEEEEAKPTTEEVCNQSKQTCCGQYPFAIFFILGNELCERFSYYGMRAILVLYLTRWLLFSSNQATAIFHAFSMVCYLMPLVGAGIADSCLGRYRTILYLSMVYGAGNLVMSLTALPPPEWVGPAVGLLLIGIGTGGIKSSVAAFGADQFGPGEEKERDSFFSVFYFMINFGSFLSIIITPLLRAYVTCFGGDCYVLAFGVPALLMLISIVLFIAGRNKYKKVPPSGNIIGKTFRCIFIGLKGKCRSRQHGGAQKEHWLDFAQSKFEAEFIEDVKMLLNVLFMYLPLPIFWALSDQQGSRWTLQAELLNGDIGVLGRIEPEQMSALNPILILILIPIFDKGVYPLLDKCQIPNRPLQRIVVGLFISSFAFVVAGFVQIKIDSFKELPLSPGEAGVTFINNVPCDLDVQSTVFSGRIPKWQASEYYRVASNNYSISVNSACNTLLSVNTSFQFSTETPYRMIAVLSNGNLQIFQVLDRRVKPNNGNAQISIFPSDDVQDTVIKFVPKGDESHVTMETGINIKVSKNQASVYTDMKPKEYKVFQSYTNSTEWKNLNLAVKLGVGAVYTGLLHDGSLQDNSMPTMTLLPSVPENMLSMAWMIPQYILITVGEVLVSITGLAFSYSQAPDSMKSVVQSFWLLTVSFGDLVVIIVANIHSIPNQTAEFFLFAVLMAVDTVIFMVMSMFYKYRSDTAYKELKVRGSSDDMKELVANEQSGEYISLHSIDKK